MTTQKIVTLLTDFGQGPYVAQMKAVILSDAPHVRIVDIFHDVAPQNITEAAFILAAAAPAFPPGAVHCAVVDPGVGTSRRIVLVEADARVFLAPDNGLLTLVLEKASPVSAWSVENENYFRRPVSPTFNGRDVFAPVAAAICAGENPRAFGPEIAADSIVRLSIPKPRRTPAGLDGEVVFVDRFGNLVTNLDTDALEALGDPSRLSVSCAETTVRGILTAYADAAPGAIVALVGSSGYLEIALVNGSAATSLSAGPASRISLKSSAS